MNGKKWVGIFFVLSLVFVALLNTVNYVIDPFNIFHTKTLKHQYQMNERFIKIEYLEENNKKFNGYMFGSSRIGVTPPKVIEKYIPNSKFYNFTISSANLYDYLTHLEYFIKQKYPINTLYLQLDIDKMGQYGRLSSDYLRKLHPYTLNKSLTLYYMDYLNGFFPFNIKGKILENINHTNRTDYFLDTGIWTQPDNELAIKTDFKKYEKGVEEFNKKTRRTFKYRISEKSMRALKNIKLLCIKNNIKLFLFTTPHNKNMMDGFIVDDYLRYLKEISNITDFYDFSGYNTITMNNYNYYESSHYRPLVGGLIAGKIFKDDTVEIPEDFGVFVTRTNIDKHLKNLKIQIENYDLNKTLSK
jgi:hypothetical protein